MYREDIDFADDVYRCFHTDFKQCKPIDRRRVKGIPRECADNWKQYNLWSAVAQW